AKCPYCKAAVHVPAGAKNAVATPAVAAAGKSVRPPSAEFIGLDKPVAGPVSGKPYRRHRGNPVMKLMILVLLLFALVGGAFAAIKFKLVDTSSLLAKVGIKSGTAADTKKGSTEPVTKGTGKEGTTTKPASTDPKDGPQAVPLPDEHFLPDGTAAVASLNL